MAHKPGIGAIFGIVSENGTAKEGSPVYLFDMRRSVKVADAKILARQLTRPDGGFSFTGLDPGYSGYAVMASDEDGAEPKNALIQDRVQPVPSHAGAGAYLEWYSRAFRDGAVAGILPWPVQGNPPKPLGMTGGILLTGTTEGSGGMLPIPEIPPMSGVKITPDGAISTYGRTQDAFPTDGSIEFVVDLDSADPLSTPLEINSTASCLGQAGRRALSMGTSMASDYGKTLFRVNYDFSQKRLRLYIGGSNNLATSQAEVLVLNADMSAQSGICHIVVTFSAAKNACAYVNGSLLLDVPTTKGITWINNEWNGHMLTVGGAGAGFNSGGDYLVGLSAGYAHALTAQQVSEHYRALFDNDLISLFTGYAKEVMTDLPIWYYRLNETEFAGGFSGELEKRDQVTNLSPARSLLHVAMPGLLVGLQDSPMVGRNAFYKPAAQTLSGARAGTLGFAFNDQATVSAWAYFSKETHSAQEVILSLDRWGATEFLRLYRHTTGQVRMDVHSGAALETVSFDYIAPAGEWLNIWAVIDKTIEIPEARLYVGTESSAPELVSTKLMSSASLYTMQNHFGGFFPNGNSAAARVGQNLEGRLCEIALFPLAIPLDRIQEIWAAKDTP